MADFAGKRVWFLDFDNCLDLDGRAKGQGGDTEGGPGVLALVSQYANEQV